MTYDHNTASPAGAPNAPIEWIEEQSSLNPVPANLKDKPFCGE